MALFHGAVLRSCSSRYSALPVLAISSRNRFAQYPKPECCVAGVKGIEKHE
jgi:hypothetical protein